jgi:glycosyltransferase involved in cell wall biosynthesis
VLIVSPATRFGSWAWIEKALEQHPGRVVVVAFGRSESAPPNVHFVSLPPLVDYGRWGVKLAERRFLVLNLLYYAPLIPLAWFVVMRERPRLLVANGVFAAAILAPFATGRRRLVLAFHGAIAHAGSRWHRVLQFTLGRVDRAFVNSTGSADDLGHAMPRDRITVVEHWADQSFFDVPLDRAPSDRLRVVYVGRMDSEKAFDQCLRVCKPLAAAGIITLTAVGDGPLAGDVAGEGIENVGYVADKHRLASLYTTADVAWAAADVTYVTLPGVEALAAGCPLLIPDVPAVFTHAQAGEKVPRSLIPEDVCALVDSRSDDEATTVLRNWAAAGIAESTRERCRRYAADRYSARNIDPFVEALAAT